MPELAEEIVKGARDAYEKAPSCTVRVHLARRCHNAESVASMLCTMLSSMLVGIKGCQLQ